MSFSHSSTISEDTDNASDIDEGRDLIGLDELLCNYEIDHIFNSQAFQQYQKELNPEKKKKVTRNFLQDVKSRIQEDLQTNFAYSERQPCQKLYWDLCEQVQYNDSYLERFVEETVSEMHYRFFKTNENDIFFQQNEHGLRIKNKLVEIDVLVTEKLKQDAHEYYRLINSYAESLKRIFEEKKVKHDENQHYHLYGQIVEIIKFTEELLCSDIVPQNIFNDYNDQFEPSFMACLKYFAQNAVTSPSNLQGLRHYYQQGVSQLSSEVFQQLQQQGFMGAADDVGGKHKYIDQGYKQLLKSISTNGKLLKICSEDNIKNILRQIIKKFISGTEPASLVVRPVSGYTELIDHCWASKPNQSNRISTSIIYKLNTFENDKNLSKEIFSELFLLDLQNALKYKLQMTLLLLKQIEKANDSNKQSALKKLQKQYNRIFENSMFLSIQQKQVKTFVDTMQYGLFDDFIEDMLYQDLLNVDVYSSQSELENLMPDIIQKIQNAYQNAQNKEFFIQLMKQQLSQSPIFIQLIANYILRDATLSVNLSEFQNTVTDESILKILRHTYSQLMSENKSDPESAEFLISQEQTDLLIKQDTTLYHFNDVLAPVLFLDKKPLMLFSDLSACGQNRWLYYLLAFIMEKQLPNISVDIQIPKTLEQFTSNEENPCTNAIFKSVMQNAADIVKNYLREQATSFLAREGYASLQGNINIKPFNYNLQPPKVMESEVIANFKNQRICVAIKTEHESVRFVIVDQYGHYIAELELREYFKSKLFNPNEKNSDLQKMLDQYFHGGHQMDMYNDRKLSQKVEKNPMEDEENEDVKLFTGYDKEYVIQQIQKSFSQLKKDFDIRVQRIIEEARLLDFLLSHAVQVIFIGISGFRTKQLKQNIESTVKFIHQQGKYLPDSAYRDSDRIFVPQDGLRGIVDNNPLYIPGLLFKPLKPAQFISRIRISKVQLQIPSALTAMLPLNEFDLSMSSREDRYYVYGMEINDIQAHQSYCRSQTKNLMTILDNYITTNYVHHREGLGITTVPWTYGGGKLNIQESAGNIIQRLHGVKHAEDQSFRDRTTMMAIWAARFATDPLSCYAALAEGGYNVEQLLRSYLINFLPQLQAYRQDAVLDVIRPVPQQSEVFNHLLKTSDQVQTYAFYALQISACKRAYDVNLMFVAPHYVYVLMLLPRMTAPKLQYLVRNAQAAGGLTRDKIRKLLQADDQDQKILGNTSINIFGQLQEIEQGGLRGEYFASKETIASAILQQLISFNVRGCVALQRIQELEREQFQENSPVNVAEQCTKIPKIANVQQIIIASPIRNCVTTHFPYRIFIEKSSNKTQLLEQVKQLSGIEIDWNDIDSVYTQQNIQEEKQNQLNMYISWIFLGQELSDTEKWERGDIGEWVPKLGRKMLHTLLKVTDQLWNEISSSTTITTDVLYATPTSPYAIPLSYEALHENQLIGTLHCMGKLMQFYGGGFRPELYVSRCGLEVKGDQTLTLDINRFVMALDEIRYEVNYEIYGGLNRYYKYLAIPCAFGDITRNMHEEAGFQGELTETETSDAFTESSENYQQSQRRKREAKNKGKPIQKETESRISESFLRPKYRSWYIRQKDVKNICWSDQFALTETELRAILIIARIANKLQEAEQGVVRRAFDSLQSKEEALGKLYYVKNVKERMQTKQSGNTQDNFLTAYFHNETDLERKLNLDVSTWAGQIAQQLFYSKDEQRFHFRVFGDLEVGQKAKALLANNPEPFLALLQLFSDDQSEWGGVKQKNRSKQVQLQLLSKFLSAFEENKDANVSSQLLELFGVDNPLRTVDQVDEDEMLDIFTAYLSALNEETATIDVEAGNAILKRKKNKKTEEDRLDVISQKSLESVLHADPLLEGALQAIAPQSASFSGLSRTEFLWKALFNELSCYDISLLPVPDIRRLLSVFQTKPIPAGVVTYGVPERLNLSLYQVETDQKLEFLYQAGRRSFKDLSRYEQFQLQMSQNQNMQTRNPIDRPPRVTCDLFNGVPCYVVGATNIAPGQSFIGFLDSVAFDGSGVTFTRVSDDGEQNQNLCDILQQYYENGWRSIILKLLVDDSTPLEWHYKSSYTPAFVQVQSLFNQPRFNQFAQSDAPATHLRVVTADEIEQHVKWQKGNSNPAPEVFGRRLSLAQQLAVAFPGRETVNLVNQIAEIHSSQEITQKNLMQMLLGFAKALEPNTTVTNAQICQQVFKNGGSLANDISGEALDGFDNSTAHRFTRDIFGVGVQQLPLLQLLKLAHCNIKAVLFYLTRLASQKLSAALRNAVDPQGDVVDFERVVAEKERKFFMPHLTVDEVRGYLQKQRGNVPVFIPVSGSYESIYMFGPFKITRNADVQSFRLRIYENLERKPQSGKKWLSQDLIVRPYEGFTGLPTDLRERELHYGSLEEVFEGFYGPLLEHIREFCGSRQMRVCGTIQEVQDAIEQGVYVVPSDAASLRFSYMYRRSNKSLTHEYLYLVWGGFVFRNTFIPGNFTAFKAWIQKNFRTHGVTGGHYAVTDIDRHKFE